MAESKVDCIQLCLKEKFRMFTVGENVLIRWPKSN